MLWSCVSADSAWLDSFPSRGRLLNVGDSTEYLFFFNFWLGVMSLNVFLATLMPICGNHGGGVQSLRTHVDDLNSLSLSPLIFSLVSVLVLCDAAAPSRGNTPADRPTSIEGSVCKTPKMTKRTWCYMWVKSSRAAVQTKLSFRQQPPEVITLNSSRHTRRSTVLLTVMIFSDSLSTLCSISAVLDPWIPVLMVDNWNQAASHSLYRNTRQLHDSHWTHWGETKHSSRV